MPTAYSTDGDGYYTSIIIKNRIYLRKQSAVLQGSDTLTLCALEIHGRR
jgi:hypothetical protein